VNADAVVAEDLARILAAAREPFERLSGRRLLITGGAGFLGYYLVQAPLAWNRANPGKPPIRVVVFDNFLLGAPEWLKQLGRDPNLSVRTHDVRAPLPADEAPFHYVLHAASVASPTFYRKYPLETIDANVSGVRHLLDHARQRKDFEGLLYFSSSEIYGDPLPGNVPIPESYRGNVSCTGPRACYDEAKRFCETLCVTFVGQHGVPAKIVRPFNNYGPGLKLADRRVIADFARDVLERRDIRILSDGSPTRTFCYISDAVTGYFATLVLGRPGEPYNIGTPAPEISVRELAERMAAAGRRLFGYAGKLVLERSEDRNYLVDNPARRVPALDKAARELGYRPAVGLDEGLERSLVWFSGAHG
jgi:UDP-glucuronate decarboxylase